jgi:hypothetical protein
MCRILYIKVIEKSIVISKVVKSSVLETPKSGWNSRNSEDRALLREFIKTRPKNVPLTDEEIQEEVNIVRYGNKYGKPGRKASYGGSNVLLNVCFNPVNP